MSHLGHPADMLLLGCSKEITVLQAFQTYLELCEYYALNDVEYHLCKELDLIYLTVWENGVTEVYVPIYVKESIQPDWITSIQRYICSKRNTKKFNLAIRDSDTTHVIFRVTNGLVPPLSPEEVKLKKKEEEEKEVVTAELKKCIPDLFKRILEEKMNDC